MTDIKVKKARSAPLTLAEGTGVGRGFGDCALVRTNEEGGLLAVFVGVITGVGGGVLRDVLSGNTPYIFVKHFYACASLVGAIFCAVCWTILGSVPSMLIGASTIIVLRNLAAHYRWSLPRIEEQDRKAE